MRPLSSRSRRHKTAHKTPHHTPRLRIIQPPSQTTSQECACVSESFLHSDSTHIYVYINSCRCPPTGIQNTCMHSWISSPKGIYQHSVRINLSKPTNLRLTHTTSEGHLSSHSVRINLSLSTPHTCVDTYIHVYPPHETSIKQTSTHILTNGHWQRSE